MRPQGITLFLQVGQLAFDGFNTLFRVVLASNRLALDLKLADLLLEVVQLSRHAVDFHAQVRRGLVDQVDGLVGHETVADVSLRDGGGRDQRAVADPDPVMDLVPFLESAQDGHGVFDGRFADVNGGESPFERGVFLDVLPVFVEGRRAHAAQRPPRQRRLEHVGSVHGPFRGARTDDGVQFIDEQDDVARRLLHFLQHGLESFLELAAELGAGQHGAHIETDDLASLEGFRYVLGHDFLGQAFHDGRLSNTGFADEHGIVLGPPGQHLDHTPDFLVPSDDRVEPAFPGEIGQIPAELLQGLVAGFRRLARDALASPDFLHGLHYAVTVRARILHDTAGLPGVFQQCEEQVLDADVFVLHALRLFQRAVQYALESVGGVQRRPFACYPGKLVKARRQAFTDPVRIRFRLFQQRGGQAFVLFKQGQCQVSGLQPVMVSASGDLLGDLKRFHRSLRQFVGAHIVCLLAHCSLNLLR